MRWMSFAIGVFVLVAIQPLAAQEPGYQQFIRPILDKHCTGCHQPASKQSDLDLTTYTGFQAGGRRGAAFVAGSPEQSLVMQFVTGALKPSMPLGQSLLAANDISTIRDWISAGARDDSPSEIVSNYPPPTISLPSSPRCGSRQMDRRSR